jgi:DNA (cytosine-5)-methyltransferase 1
MKVVDLFSGIGGFSLGLERAGMETIAFCEIEPYCQKVLKRHWPDVPLYDDVRKLDGKQFFNEVDLICGGYPCQPFSAAGKRRGEHDERHLWPEMFRLIREACPPWIVAENVRGHISLGFDTVASQLEGAGFTVWPFIIPACALGAPHRRERLWIVAWSETNANRKALLGNAAVELRDAATAKNGSSDSECSEIRSLRESRQKLSRKSDRFDSWTGWLDQSPILRVADGIPNTMDRLRALGNSVVPQIPEMLGRAIIKFSESPQKPFSFFDD